MQLHNFIYRLSLNAFSVQDLMAIQKYLVHYYLMHRTRLLHTHDIHYANAYLPTLSPYDFFPFLYSEIDKDEYNPTLVQMVESKLEVHSTFKLSQTPIIPWIWDKERSASCLKHIGNPKSPWKQDGNHQVEYWFPMNIGLVYGGNHSLNSGILQVTGDIIPCDVKDISNFYALVNFKKDKYEVTLGDFSQRVFVENEQAFGGILFEIGRLLKIKKFNFLIDYVKFDENIMMYKDNSLKIIDNIIRGFLDSYIELEEYITELLINFRNNRLQYEE